MIKSLPARAARLLFGHRPAGPAPFAKLRVATIVDDFTRACLEPEVTLLAIDARAWRLQLATFQPQLLFVESAWRGVHDSWKKRIASYPDRDDDTLSQVLRWCRRRSVPTVFWNKEDPVHFDRFVRAALQFDQVFTTEVKCVERYRTAGVSRVQPLLFAAQPALHYPGTSPRENVVCFAGSYGEAELGARRVDLEALLDGAMDATPSLRILDRQATAKTTTNTFPARYQPFVQPGVDYRALAELQRRYKVFLNVNAIRSSRTMFGRRVFELLASGAAVVSSPNEGIRELFGGVVTLAGDRDAASFAIRRLLEDDTYRNAIAARGIERVAAGHTYAHRLREVCAAVGLQAPAA
jgi:hypothetical protein